MAGTVSSNYLECTLPLASIGGALPAADGTAHDPTTTMFRQDHDSSGLFKTGHSIKFNEALNTPGSSTNSFRATQENYDVFFTWSGTGFAVQMLFHTYVLPSATIPSLKYKWGFPFWGETEDASGNPGLVFPNYVKMHIETNGSNTDATTKAYGVQVSSGKPFFVTGSTKMNEIECQATGGEATCYYYGTESGSPPDWVTTGYPFPYYANFHNYWMNMIVVIPGSAANDAFAVIPMKSFCDGTNCDELEGGLTKLSTMTGIVSNLIYMEDENKELFQAAGTAYNTITNNKATYAEMTDVTSTATDGHFISKVVPHCDNEDNTNSKCVIGTKDYGDFGLTFTGGSGDAAYRHKDGVLLCGKASAIGGWSEEDGPYVDIADDNKPKCLKFVHTEFVYDTTTPATG